MRCTVSRSSHLPYKLVDGQFYTVRHPDFISVPTLPRGRNLVIHDNEGMHLIDLNLVVEVQVPDAAASSPQRDSCALEVAELADALGACPRIPVRNPQVLVIKQLASFEPN